MSPPLLGSNLVTAGGDAKHELTLLAKPPFGYVNRDEYVKFSVIVYKGVDEAVDTVRLLQTDAKGNPVTESAVMNDDGKDGDYEAGDGEYTATLTIRESSPVTRYYQAIANIRNNFRKTSSQIRKFRITEKPYSKEPDEDKIVYGQGTPFPVNHVIIRLPEDGAKATAQSLASLVNSDVVGYTPTLNLYLLEVPAETVEDLDAIIGRLDADPRTVHAKRNLLLQPELE